MNEKEGAENAGEGRGGAGLQFDEVLVFTWGDEDPAAAPVNVERRHLKGGSQSDRERGQALFI